LYCLPCPSGVPRMFASSRKSRFARIARLAFGLLMVSACHAGWAAAADDDHKKAEEKPKAAATAEAKKFPDWDTVIKDAKKLDGLFTLYFNEKEQHLLMEIRKD